MENKDIGEQLVTQGIAGSAVSFSVTGECGVGCQVLRWARVGAVMAGVVGSVLAADQPSSDVYLQTSRFEISGFEVVGSRIFSGEALQGLVSAYVGPAKEYGDIQRAVEAIEFAYRKRGYAAVQVYAPEQELTGGNVKLQVIEATVGKVVIEGETRHFDIANLRAGIPALVEGQTPNARELSSQIALANENPAKQVEVVLGIGSEEGKVDARLKTVQSAPLKTSLTLDNTGSEQTGRHRIGVALQHANLWNRDHVGTVAYQTSPEKPSQVDIYSLSYRIPIYAWAGAIDLILAKSTVNSGITPTTAGNLAFAGSGTILGLRYTHTLPREGDLIQKLILGWDIKANDNTCTLGSYGATGCGPAATDVTLRPLSLTYNRLTVAPGQATELNATLVTNLRGGNHGREADFNAARPGTSGGASADYTLLRGTLTHLHILEGDWQARFVLNGQWTAQALLTQEQLGLAGSNAVRGFQEREVARDTGAQINLEGYTPSFAGTVGVDGNLRALAFLDAAQGRNHLLSGETQPKHTLASWGLGLRYAAGKDLSAKLDVAQILTANGNTQRGDWRGHLNLMIAF